MTDETAADCPVLVLLHLADDKDQLAGHNCFVCEAELAGHDICRTLLIPRGTAFCIDRSRVTDIGTSLDIG